MSPMENEAADQQQQPAAPTLVSGIDLGNSKSVIAAGQTGTPVGKADLVINEMSNRATPTLVSFNGRERAIGEAAQGQLGVNPKNTANGLMRILGKDFKECQAHRDPHMRYSLAADNRGRAVAQVEYKGEQLQVLPEQMLGMLMAQLMRHARGGAPNAAPRPLGITVISVPAVFSDRQRSAVMAAARIAGLPEEHVYVVDSGDAAISCYNVQHSQAEDAPQRHILLLDAGHAFTSCSIYRLTPGARPERLSNSSSDSIGGSILDRHIFTEFQVQCAAKGVELKEGTRPGYRLLVECEKVKRTLSTIPEASTVIECVGEQEKDVKLTISRPRFEELCANEQAGLAAMVEGAVKGAGLSAGDISAVEMVGGTSRVPWVRKVVADVFGGNEEIISTRLDSSSCFALGAAFIAEAAALEPMLEEGFKSPAAVEKLKVGINRVMSLPGERRVKDCGWPPEEMESALALEAEMQRQDEEEAAKADARNSLESFILQMRSAVSEGKHGGSMKEELVGPLLDASENWMYGEGEERDLVSYQEHLKDLQDKVQSACPEWFAAEEAERKQIEEELTAQYQAALQESEGKEKEDHDFRKMSKPERMRLVNLNKEEANELYKGGNTGPAVQRWQKALQHAGKFFDLSEEDKKEVDGIVMSLHLNLAMGYLKLAEAEAARDSKLAKDNEEQYLKKARDSCTDALQVDGTCAKAYFRRATAMEKLKCLDEAFDDCKKALEIEPDDKMIIRLYERVKKGRAARLEKEKNFAKKMFG